MKVLMIGSGRFVRILAANQARLGAETTAVDLLEWREWSFARRAALLRAANLVHFYWGWRIRLEELAVCRAAGTRILYTFIGSDVGRMRKASAIKRLRSRLGLRLASRVTAVAPWLVSELDGMGIASTAMPFAGVRPGAGPPPLPASFTVFSYIPEGKADFYGWSAVRELAERLPSAQFAIAGCDGTGLSAPPNVRFHGWVEPLSSLMAQTNAVVRLTRHDGLARTVLEGLSMARHVVWTYAFPYCVQHRDAQTTASFLQSLAAGPALNLDGARHVAAVYGEDRVMENVRALYRELAGNCMK